MKKLLIPTDFSVRSLHIVHDIVMQNAGKKIIIYIIHMVHIPTDFSELLFYKKSYLYNKVPVAFTEAIQMLRNRYSSKCKLELRFVYGNHVKALNMAIESFAIDEICISGQHQYKLPLPNSVDLIPMLPNCNAPVYHISSTSVPGLAEEADRLSSLFTEGASCFSINRPSAF